MSEAVAVRLGEAQFGLPVASVREVLRVPHITRLPFPPPAVLGIMGVRGTLVPVLDLGMRLLGSPASREGRVVVVWDERSDGPVGLLVDAVLDLIPAVGEAVEAPPEVAASLPAGWIDRVLSPGPDRLVVLLHLSPILDLSTPPAEEGR